MLCCPQTFSVKTGTRKGRSEKGEGPGGFVLPSDPCNPFQLTWQNCAVFYQQPKERRTKMPKLLNYKRMGKCTLSLICAHSSFFNNVCTEGGEKKAMAKPCCANNSHSYQEMDGNFITIQIWNKTLFSLDFGSICHLQVENLHFQLWLQYSDLFKLF